MIHPDDLDSLIVYLKALDLVRDWTDDPGSIHCSRCERQAFFDPLVVKVHCDGGGHELDLTTWFREVADELHEAGYTSLAAEMYNVTRGSGSTATLRREVVAAYVDQADDPPADIIEFAEEGSA